MAADAPPRLASIVGGLDAPWTPASEGDAQAALAQIAAFCDHKCPVVDHCVEGRCRLWRLEQEAARFIREGPPEGQGVIAL
jgi:hypothetical protein